MDDGGSQSSAGSGGGRGEGAGGRRPPAGSGGEGGPVETSSRVAGGGGVGERGPMGGKVFRFAAAPGARSPAATHPGARTALQLCSDGSEQIERASNFTNGSDQFVLMSSHSGRSRSSISRCVIQIQGLI